MSLFASNTEMAVPSKGSLVGSFWDLNLKNTEDDIAADRMYQSLPFLLRVYFWKSESLNNRVCSSSESNCFTRREGCGRCDENVQSLVTE